MKMEELHLELTRNCTLECEHCLRGEKEVVNMSTAVLDEIAKSEVRIERLLLTGGEPLIAIQALEYLAELIKNKKIKVSKLVLITNGTVKSERVLRVLRDFQNSTHLILKLSTDVFHQVDLERKGLLELRDRNLGEYNQAGFYSFSKYGGDYKRFPRHGLTGKGRAATISSERLKEIGDLAGVEFVVDDGKNIIRDIFWDEGKLHGSITIDVYGNVVEYGLSFKEEDEFAYEHGWNITQMPFRDAVQAFVDNNTVIYEEAFNKLGL